MENDFEIYPGRNFSSLVKGIVDSSEQRREQILVLIEDLRGLIKGVGDVAVIAPFIKEYISVSSSNDANLTKLAAVLTRMIINNNRSGNDILLSEEEKKQLLCDVNFAIDEIKNEDDIIENKIKAISKDSKNAIS